MTESKISGLLGLSAKAGKICFGRDACIDLIQKKKIKLIIVAIDASDRTKKEIKFICNNNDTRICFYGTIEKLSKAIGKSNKAIIGIKEENFAKQIEKIINGGEVIG